MVREDVVIVEVLELLFVNGKEEKEEMVNPEVY